MKIFNIYTQVLIFSTIALLTASCQDVIQIDLNSSDPQIVVDGKVSNADSFARVKLTSSVNFDQANVFPPVTGANVTITDSNGAIYTLSENTIYTDANGASHSTNNPGYYSCKLQGTVGLTYYLTIHAMGKTLTSSATLPPSLAIDTMYIEDTGGFNPPDVPSQYIKCVITDPANEINFYRFVESINGKVDPYIYVGDDKLLNGTTFNASMFGSKMGFSKGDTVTIKMQMLDKMACGYLISLSDLTQQGGGSAAPTNPKTNIIGGGLGYFSAYSEVQQSLIVK